MKVINTNRTILLLVGGGGGRSFLFTRSCWVELFSTVPRNSPQNLSRNSNSLQRRGSVTSSSTSGVTQQQQAFRLSSSCEEALGLSGQQRSDGHLVTGLLQSSLSGFQTGRILRAHHRPQEVKPLPGNSFFQDGNSFLHRSSSPTTWMDYQDRSQRCLSSYPSSCEHSQVLSFCYCWKDLPVPCSPIWTLNGAPLVHQNISNSGSAAPYSGNKRSCLPRRLEHPGRFTRTESPTYSTDHPTPAVSGMDYQLEEVYARSLTHPRLLGPTFQSRESHNISSRLILRFSHQCPIPSISIYCHACMQDLFHYKSNLALRPLYPSRAPTTQVPAVLDKETLGSAQTVLGHSNPAGCRLSFSPPLVQQTGRSLGSSSASAGTQPVLLHRCITNRMGSQSARSSPLGTVVSPGLRSAHQLAEARGHPISCSSVGTSVD